MGDPSEDDDSEMTSSLSPKVKVGSSAGQLVVIEAMLNKSRRSTRARMRKAVCRRRDGKVVIDLSS